MDFFRNYYPNTNWFLPVAAVSMLLLTHAGKKFLLIGYGAYGLALGKDRNLSLPDYDPQELISMNTKNISKKETKTLYLVRHAESTWNVIANRGINWTFPFRLLLQLATETILFMVNDSVLLDAPLSPLGIKQSKQLSIFLKSSHTIDPEKQSNHLINLLNNEKENDSIIVSSPLRRCLETIVLGLFSRIRSKKEKIYIVSSLQEITGNIDGLSLSGTHKMPPISQSLRSIEAGCDFDGENDWDEFFEKRIDLSYKESFKCKEKRGDNRIKSFVEWMFLSKESKNVNNIIISGHSLWFKSFFNCYLPRHKVFDAKLYKIKNAGIVKIEFTKVDLVNTGSKYYIDPDSIEIVYGGFDKPYQSPERRNLL